MADEADGAGAKESPAASDCADVCTDPGTNEDAPDVEMLEVRETAEAEDDEAGGGSVPKAEL